MTLHIPVRTATSAFENIQKVHIRTMYVCMHACVCVPTDA